MSADPQELIDLVYEAAVDLDAWHAAIVRIADAIRAPQVTFQFYDPGSTAISCANVACSCRRAPFISSKT